VKRSLLKMSLISCGALLATQAFAQSASKAPVDVPKTQTAAANAKAAKSPVALASITATGSLIVLADGIVANATLATIQPPGEGFLYER
jgi:hypothetical protein